MSQPLPPFANLTPEQKRALLKNLLKRKITEPFTQGPLSLEQERLWHLDQIAPGNPAYNIATVLRLNGCLNIECLQRCLKTLCSRHQSLRTIFQLHEGRPNQIVYPGMELDWKVADLTKHDAIGMAEEMKRLAESEIRRPFDLAKGPLFRTLVIHQNADEHVVVLTLHHIISDVWSLSALAKELDILYGAFAHGKPSPLPPLAFDYADFINWQKRAFQGKALEERLGYWRHKLANLPDLLEVPADRPRPKIPHFRGDYHPFELPQGLCQALRDVGREEGATLFMVLLALFKGFLSRLSGETDIVIASPVSGRSLSEFTDVIGFFAYPAVFRTDLSGDPTLNELIGRTREVTLEAYQNQEVPLAKIASVTRTKRYGNRNALFQIMFTLVKSPKMAFQEKNPRFGPVDIGAWTGPTDLDLYLAMEEMEENGKIAGSLAYNPDLFDKETIRTFISFYVRILEKTVIDRGMKLSAIELPEAIRQKTRMGDFSPGVRSICIAATFTSEPIRDSLEFWMNGLEIPSRIQFAPYHQEFQQILDPQSLLSRNREGCNVIFVRLEDWEGVESDAVERNLRDFAGALRGSAYRKVPYFIFLCPFSSAVFSDPAKAIRFRKLENLLLSELEGLNGVYAFGTSEVNSFYPTTDYETPTGSQIGHIPYSTHFFTALGTLVARKISSLWRPARKVIVLDCDQTLWKGVCGEDGFLGIEIDSPRKALQEFMVAQSRQGKVICLCSKNNENDVWNVFEHHSGMPLRREDIVASKINWEPKPVNLRALSQELQLGLDSFIFIDDSPIECAEAQAGCPEVLTLQLPAQADRIPSFLKHVWAFDQLKVTDEDRNRRDLYVQNLERDRFLHKSLSLADFQAGLDLKVVISEVEPDRISRVAQLTQRTNQFNTTTIRRFEADIENLCRTGEWECLGVEVSDRFGKYGLVGVMIFRALNGLLEVDTFLLSCRALGRGVEHQMLAKLGKIAGERGLKGVELCYIPTERNKPAFDFLETVGEAFRENLPGRRSYRFSADFAADIEYKPAQPPQSAGSGPTLGEPPPLTQATPAHGIGISHDKLVWIASHLDSAESIDEFIRTKNRRMRPQAAGEMVGPRTELELKLAELVARILELEKIGIHDDFFELGGTSLNGIQFLSDVQTHFGVKLTLRHFTETPTVAKWAQVIEALQHDGMGLGRGPPLDLDGEVNLDKSIAPPKDEVKCAPGNPTSVFLTGATGFLGAFLLYELLEQTHADVYCLVRAKDFQEGKRRIIKNLRSNFVWKEAFEKRIIAVLGDLSEPFLGLSPEEFQGMGRKVDVILHNGAMVNFVYPYAKLKASNVLGTQEVLRLACLARAKPVHYISTAAVFGSIRYNNQDFLKEEDFLEHGEGLYFGYAQSKWVAERMVMAAKARGLPVSVYRVDIISGHSGTGVMNQDDLLSRLLRFCLQLGLIPAFNTKLDILPVDFISKAIVSLSRLKESIGRVYHIVNPTAPSFEDVVHWINSLGYPVSAVPYEEWKIAALEFCGHFPQNLLTPILPLLIEEVPELEISVLEMYQRRPNLEFRNTKEGLLSLGMDFPPIDARLFAAYLTYFARSGALSR